MRALVLILCLSSTALAQEPSPAPEWHPFLWRIEGKSPSYLLGTMHRPVPRSGRWPPTLVAAMEQAEMVYVEVEVGFMTGFGFEVLEHLPHGQTLAQLIPADLLRRVEKAVRSAPNLFWFAESKKRIWAVTLDIGPATQPVGTGPMLDQALSRWAEAHHKPVGSLESLREQADVYDGLSSADQIDLLVQALDRRDRGQHAEGLEKAREAFFSGDESLLEKVLAAPTTRAARSLRQRMFTDRNARLADRIGARLRSNMSQLFAVGAGHMIGKDGIVARLRKAGIRVVRLR